MKKSKEKKIILVGIFLITIIIVIPWIRKTQWTENLIHAIEDEDEEEIQEILSQSSNGSLYDLNRGRKAPFPFCLMASFETYIEYPLEYACETENYNIIHALVEAGADVNLSADDTIKPLDRIVCQFNYSDEWDTIYKNLTYLIGNGARFSENTEVAAYLYADGDEQKEQLSVEIYQFLCESGTITNAVSPDSVIAAATNNNHQLLNYFLQNNPNVIYRKNSNGQAILLWICETKCCEDISYEDIETIKILVESGCDVEERNEEGYTAFEIAQEYGKEEVANLVRPTRK